MVGSLGIKQIFIQCLLIPGVGMMRGNVAVSSLTSFSPRPHSHSNLRTLSAMGRQIFVITQIVEKFCTIFQHLILVQLNYQHFKLNFYQL